MSFTQHPYQEHSETVSETPRRVTTVQDVAVVGQVVRPITSISGRRVRTAYTARFAPDAVIAAAVGLVLLIVGLIAITRGGFDGPMSDPIVKVLGFTHTTALGLIEIVLGAGLLLNGATCSRGGALVFGSVLGIAGFVGAVQAASFRTSLALESAMGWLAVLAGLAVAGSALLIPRFTRYSTITTPL
jgi:hypothetical protein